ncbi:MAG: type II secretion system F family protein [Firmicutes bacterium]|nr:type II secretion system F family protein [Bacillota bacterium]MDH7495172.1 type II secretion system F family protein [Bacillota bacterium]
MALLVSSLVFVSVTAIAMWSMGMGQREPTADERLKRLAVLTRVPSEREKKLARPLSERLLGPVVRFVNDLIISVTPKHVVDAVKEKLDVTGNPWNMTPGDYILMRVITLAIIPLAGFGLALRLGPGTAALLAFVLAALGWLVPEMMLQSKKRDREKQIRRSLPDVLDLLTVSVEAGLGFDAALAKVVERKKGPLAEEFAFLLQEIRMGKPRRDALRELSERVKIDDITSFIASVVQADQLGVSIANILRIQSAQVRTKRRQQAEEAGMKAPIKMLFPLVFFIFPTLFVVLLGPAIIQVATTFMTTF